MQQAFQIAGVLHSVLLVLALMFGFALLMHFYLSTDFRGEYKAKFEADLRKAVIHSQPTWLQVTSLAHAHNLNKAMAAIGVSHLLHRVLTGDDADLEPFRSVLEGYLEDYRKTTPFDGLPIETRIHLERIQAALPDRGHLLDPLTVQLKELVSMYDRRAKAQRRYTTWGFVVTVLSLAFAAYAYFSPYVPSTP